MGVGGATPLPGSLYFGATPVALAAASTGVGGTRELARNLAATVAIFGAAVLCARVLAGRRG